MKITYCPERLQQLLKDPRIKLTVLAKQVGLTPQAMYALREGRNSPSVDTLALLASSFEKNIEYFFANECSNTYISKAS